MIQLRGTITALVTPFTLEGDYDEAAMRRLVDFQINAGIDGLVVCGSTGEAATLSDEEYDRVVSSVVQQVDGRVVVIAGAGSNNTARACDLSRRALEAGVDALLHVSPFYNKPTEAGLMAHYNQIAAATDLPIIVYNVPGRTGSNLGTATTLRLANEINNVVAVKEASGNIEQVMAIIKGAPDGFTILSGDDALTLPMMALGAKGVISVASNPIPHELAEMTARALAGDFGSARKLHYEWLDIMDVCFIETNPQPVKTALALMGIVEESFRLPLVRIQDESRQKLIDIMKGHRLI